METSLPGVRILACCNRGEGVAMRKDTQQNLQRLLGLKRAFLITAIVAAQAIGSWTQDTSISELTLQSCAMKLASEVDSAYMSSIAVNDTIARQVRVVVAVTNFTVNCLGLRVQAERALRIMVPKTGMLPRLQQRAQEFGNETGIRVVLNPVEFYQVGSEIVQELEAELADFSDGWVVDPAVTGDVAARGGFKSLDEYIPEDPSIEWNDISTFFRTTSAIYDRKVVAIPLDGDLLLLYYRRDLFERYNLSVPVTWDDFTALAISMNNTDTDGDDVGDLLGACFDIAPPVCKGNFLLYGIAAPYLQYLGTSQGVFYNADDMRYLADNDAMARAVEHYVTLWGLSQPNGKPTCAASNSDFRNGRCLMTVNFGDEFKSNAHRNSTNGIGTNLSVAPLPGSTEVLDRTTGRLLPCTDRRVCPYSKHVRLANGTLAYVNFAPYSAFGGWAGAVSALAPALYQKRAYQFFAYLVQPNNSWNDVLDLSTGVDPYRSSQLQADGPNFERWVAAGFNHQATQAYLDSVNAALENENMVLDSRLDFAGSSTRLVIESALHNLTWYRSQNPNITVRGLLGVVEQLVMARLHSKASVDELRRQYCKLIGCEVVEGHRSRAATPAQVAIYVLVPVSVTALALACVVIMWRRHTQRRYMLTGSVKAPGAGPATTLLVTDIESSTALWELLPESVMDAALDLHHTVVRRALFNHKGYESATEGDSFLCAFHSARQAVACALAIQQELLAAPWPPELLAWTGCPAAAEVFLAPGPLHSELQTLLTLGSVAQHHHRHQQQQQHCPPEAVTSLGSRMMLRPNGPECASSKRRSVIGWLGRGWWRRWQSEGELGPGRSGAAVEGPGGAGKGEYFGEGDVFYRRSTSTNLYGAGGGAGDSVRESPTASHSGFVLATEGLVREGGANDVQQQPQRQQSMEQLSRRGTALSAAFDSNVSGDAGGGGGGGGGRATRRILHHVRSMTLLTFGPSEPLSDGALPLGNTTSLVNRASNAVTSGVNLASRPAKSLPHIGSSGGNEPLLPQPPTALHPRVLMDYVMTAWRTVSTDQSLLAAPSSIPFAGTAMDTSVVSHGSEQVRTSVAAAGPVSFWRPSIGPSPRRKQRANASRSPVVQVYRGLRVRIGMASGVPEPTDVSYNSAEARYHYSGAGMRLARAVQGAAAGGMVLLSDSTFAQAREEAGALSMPGRRSTRGSGSGGFSEPVWLHMGCHLLHHELPPQQVYQAVAVPLTGRLLLFPPLVSKACLAVGALSAPVRRAAIAFVYVLGASSLLAWDVVVARQALKQLEEVFARELARSSTGGSRTIVSQQPPLQSLSLPQHQPQQPQQHGGLAEAGAATAMGSTGGADGGCAGYIVEATGGLLLAAFSHPAQGVAACLSTVEAMPWVEWPEALMENALCEELTVARVDGEGRVVTEVLFRGLRLKAGLDYGSVHATINGGTGRVSYRGRVMNRAARIASSASSGQVIISRDLYEAAITAADGVPPESFTAISMGHTTLKGLPESVELLMARPAQTSRPSRRISVVLGTSCDDGGDTGDRHVVGCEA